MKVLLPISSLVAAALWSVIPPADAQVNVTQFHNNPTRDGLHIDSAFTPGAAADLTRDQNFNGTIVGNGLGAGVGLGVDVALRGRCCAQKY